MAAKADTLRLILGDQLNPKHSWFNRKDPRVVYVIAELHEEATYVRHHVQKLCAFFAAMADFAAHLREAGHRVEYLTLDESCKHPSLEKLLKALCKQYGVDRFEYQRPDEYRLLQVLRELKMGSSIEVAETDSEHFLLPWDEIPEQFSRGKHRTMEAFYRHMRRRFQILMDGDEPSGGRWNFDAENRNKLPPEQFAHIPEPLVFANPVADYLERIERHKIATIGTPSDTSIWPHERRQALRLLRFFCQHCLAFFGQFQDSMSGKAPHAWSLYHSRISFALNSKMISPGEVIDAALATYEAPDSGVELAQIEGFVRQILGWREYVRGIYWANMPGYARANSLGARRALPDYFWSAETRMHCMAAAIRQSLDYAYAHHIQRLMVTGNFCLLAGIEPKQVDAWYLGIYIDAIEWVELPNTRGMSQFADGGIIATKPYAASGQYIDRMSDYCGDCHYQVKHRTEDDACPFNSLYWDFMIRHRENFEKNPRIGMIYRNWDKMEEDRQADLLKRAQWCKRNLKKL
ncbi:cryptochrome/photolyase family protein [Biformimicrobium ophioploci]|uniref:Cryptochrome/photolyase family protein n=1 Tax=Biformimicrobium ophioploci TaxID=3036711 RepID=A0ABQ6M2V9_9GAMM|nr:cryptochrome/photolyase family protein [Microbulbifer sp. NKW57]GMG88612.1 cryptochrome/photolyase family protein [Microbulbifer sp. NKW57]